MYRRNIPSISSIKINESVEGETIEQKIERVVNNGEPIKDGAPIIYTERKDGVLPGYNVRTDRFDEAIDATTKIDKANKAKRAQGIEDREKIVKKYNEDQKGEGNDGETKSTQGTNGDSSK